MSKKKNTLILVFDPLCGWCYGFGPVMIRLFEKYKDRLNFDVISGGMITGSRIGPLSNMASFINQAYKTVEDHTGVKFGPNFLNKTLKEGKVTFSSLEPAKMLTIFKQFHPEKVVEFSHEIQKLIYWDGIDPVQYHSYFPLFEKFGLTVETIKPLVSIKSYEQETVNEFGKAYSWRISGFPACIVQANDGKAYGISNGYTNFEVMEAKLKPYLV